MVSNIFWNFHPYLFGEDEPILKKIFFKWVGSTTNQRRYDFQGTSRLDGRSKLVRFPMGSMYTDIPVCPNKDFSNQNKRSFGFQVYIIYYILYIIYYILYIIYYILYIIYYILYIIYIYIST